MWKGSKRPSKTTLPRHFTIKSRTVNSLFLLCTERKRKLSGGAFGLIVAIHCEKIDEKRSLYIPQVLDKYRSSYALARLRSADSPSPLKDEPCIRASV